MVARSDAILAPTAVKPRRSAWAVIRRVGDWIGTTLAVATVMIGCVGVVVAVATHFSQDGEYTVFGHPMMVVLSGSMSPAVRTGDLVIDDPVGAALAAHLEAGQIISFQSGAKVITHRIATVQTVNGAIAYQTKGDANNSPDTTLVTPGQIIGVYHTRIPSGGYVLNALHQPLTLAFLLAAPVLWFISGLFFHWAKAVDDPAGKDAAPRRAGRKGGPR